MAHIEDKTFIFAIRDHRVPGIVARVAGRFGTVFGCTQQVMLCATKLWPLPAPVLYARQQLSCTLYSCRHPYSSVAGVGLVLRAAPRRRRQMHMVSMQPHGAVPSRVRLGLACREVAGGPRAAKQSRTRPARIITICQTPSVDG